MPGYDPNGPESSFASRKKMHSSMFLSEHHGTQSHDSLNEVRAKEKPMFKCVCFRVRANVYKSFSFLALSKSMT